MRLLAICTACVRALTCRCVWKGDRRVIGLTGEPESLRKYGELVCMTAEMMLEQSRLMHLLAQDSRLREELVMNLIQAEEHTPALNEWAQRLGIDLNQPRVVAMIEVDSGQLGVDSAMAELQQLQNALTTPDRNNLVAIVSLTEMVVLKPALNALAAGTRTITSPRRAADRPDERERPAAFSRGAGQLLYRAGQYRPLLAYRAHHDDGGQAADAGEPQLFLSGSDAAGAARQPARRLAGQ
jgi:hypothetical protein